MKVQIARNVDDLLDQPKPEDVISIRVHLPNGHHIDVTEQHGVIRVIGSGTISLWPGSTNSMNIDVTRLQ